VGRAELIDVDTDSDKDRQAPNRWNLCYSLCLWRYYWKWLFTHNWGTPLDRLYYL